MGSKRIFITGATDGIGLETAKKLKSLGHEVIVHGRNEKKLHSLEKELGVKSFRADLSKLSEVNSMIDSILNTYTKIDVLINNAGVFKISDPITKDGFDVRFVVNTFAPYLITKRLLSILGVGRVINLSSAAQSSVDIDAMLGKKKLDHFEAYAQSKLAITMWTRILAKEIGDDGPIMIAVNPASLLGTKMVREGFNTSGNDINIGVNILTSLALDDKHKTHSGEYYDNDNNRYAQPQADGSDDDKAKRIIKTIEEVL